jgi:hypothetical protein
MLIKIIILTGFKNIIFIAFPLIKFNINKNDCKTITHYTRIFRIFNK